MADKHTIYELDRGVALVTLNRPHKLNAFTVQMRNELIELITRADGDDQVRVVVLTGAGKAFCAGMDLADGAGTFDYAQRPGGSSDHEQHRDGGGQLALAIHRCKKPVIAAINGHAVGVGATMTLPMDMRVAAAEAKIGFVFSQRGIAPEACSSYFLPRLVGMGKATEWVYSGRVFPAADEAHSGLFNYVLPAAEVLPKALELAREIADNTSAISVTLAKAMLWHGLDEPDPQAAHLVESRIIHWIGGQADAREGVNSFLEKRPAQFKMRPSRDLPDFYPWWQETEV